MAKKFIKRDRDESISAVHVYEGENGALVVNNVIALPAESGSGVGALALTSEVARVPVYVEQDGNLVLLGYLAVFAED
jgi:hypothetical protein